MNEVDKWMECKISLVTKYTILVCVALVVLIKSVLNFWIGWFWIFIDNIDDNEKCKWIKYLFKNSGIHFGKRILQPYMCFLEFFQAWTRDIHFCTTVVFLQKQIF